MTVVGVAQNVRHYGVTENAPPEVYIPLVQANDVALGWMNGTAEIMLRTQTDGAQVLDELRAMIRRIDPSIPVHHVESMKERVAATLQQRRFITTLLTSFAALATFLAAIGIYGVLSYVVSLRTQEIGIRIAVGAQQSQVLRMLLADGLRLAAVGTAIGIAGALAGGGLVSSLLFNVAPNDPTTFTAGALMVIALALLASYVPASRALQIDPIIALRNE